MVKRTDRLNSLLKEVLSEVIRRDIHHNPLINEFVTITRVAITTDLSYAKVYVSVIGDEKKKKEAVSMLQERSRLIRAIAYKKVRMRQFPELDFVIDSGLEKQLHMEELLQKISEERASRQQQDSS